MGAAAVVIDGVSYDTDLVARWRAYAAKDEAEARSMRAIGAKHTAQCLHGRAFAYRQCADALDAERAAAEAEGEG